MMPDEKSIIVSSWDNCVYMYSVEYGRILETTMAHDDAVSSVFWNDGLLATTSWDSTAKIWSYSGHVGVKLQTCAQLLAELDHDTKVSCVCLSSDNGHLITGTVDGHIYMWDVHTFLLISKHEVHEGEVYAISISPDNQRIISCGDDLKVLDFKTGMKIFTKSASDSFRCVTWNGQTAITGGNSGHIYIWDLLSAQLVEKLPAHEGPVTCVTISKDCRTVVTGGHDGRIVIWKTDSSIKIV